MKEYYIWLLSVMGAANPRTMRLIRSFGGIKEVYEALTSGESADFLKPAESKSLKQSSLEKSCELIEWCEKHKYSVVTFDDPEYPDRLRHIYNPPLVLFTEGEPANLVKKEAGEISINVVGTRNPSEYSCRITAVLCAELAKAGIEIVSGMAVGLDKCAMSAALENGGAVTGVLACGIDVDYPRGSRDFRKMTAESGGVCVSELMPRDSTRPTYFQYRNRIMSGMASGTLIIEAGERSGCHITALHAISQNRDLFCVPPRDILDPRYSGVARYLRDGAIPVFSHIDIINEYLSDVCIALSDKSSDISASPRALEKHAAVKPAKVVKKPPKNPPKSPRVSKRSKKSETAETAEKIENAENAIILKDKATLPQVAPKADYTQLPEEQAKIIAVLSKNRKKEMSFDEISEQVEKSKICEVSKVYEILLDLELDGFIEKIAGDRYVVIT